MRFGATGFLWPSWSMNPLRTVALIFAAYVVAGLLIFCAHGC